MEYEGRICRSPMERAAFMLPISVGCSYNACKFCTLFKHLRYRELPMEAIEAELERVKKVGGNPSRVFLGDGNAFGVNTANMDATVTNIRQKSDEELKSLKEAGVDQLYLGIETGLDDVLTFMKKDHSLQEAYEAILRLHKAGLDYAAHMMTGVAGKGRGIENAEAIAAFFNRTHPRKIVNFSLFVSTRAPLWQDVESGLFEPADELENLLEERRLIELLDLSDVSYDGLHDGIEVRIRGTLPQDREKMLSKLDQTIEAYRAKASVYAITGKEQQASDPHRTQMTE